jgi:hypothetical protein
MTVSAMAYSRVNPLFEPQDSRVPTDTEKHKVNRGRNPDIEL